MACSGCVRVYQVQETRPVVSARHAFDWILVLRALLDRLGLRSQREGLPVIVTVSVIVFQLLPHKLKADVLIDQSQQMIFGNLIFQTEVIEQRF